MKRLQKHAIFLLFFVIGLTVSSLIVINNDIKTSNIEIKNDIPHLSTTFQLTRDFEPSTYYLSPESSPGSSDGVFFSFEANMAGNYTINIENFPSAITDTFEDEMFLAMNNPKGTELYYACYFEKNFETLDDFKLHFLLSKDNGRTWDGKLIKEITPVGKNEFELRGAILGSAIAANPNTGVVGIVYWENSSILNIIRSLDNGTTWSDPIEIAKAADYGVEDTFLAIWGRYPEFTIGILKNSTIYVVAEQDHIAPDPSLTPLVYFESNDTGMTWSGVKNVTITKGGDASKKPVMLVDYITGDYWLMWKYDQAVGNVNVSWASFSGIGGESLYSNVPKDEIISFYQNNYAFFFDNYYNRFNVFQVKKVGENTEIINCTTPNFGSSWTINSLGYRDALDHKKIIDYSYIHIIGENGKYKLFFTDNYMGYFEVYRYFYQENSIFWTFSDNFSSDQLKQVFWNGRVNGTFPVPTSAVKVSFTALNGSNSITKELYLIIDNERPEFDLIDQKRTYFNPQSSNITLQEINWDLLASEESDSYLQIFSGNVTRTDWQKVSDNNWQDRNSKITMSDKKNLYILHQTNEAGQKTVNLRRSDDMGVTWTSPIRVFQTFSASSLYYAITAWGDIVIVYIYNPEDNLDYLYRSFDKGETFEDIIDISEFIHSNAYPIPEIIATKNGTLFLTYLIYNPREYVIMRSDDLGLNWYNSSTWIPFTPGYDPGLLPTKNSDLIYDSVNDLVHVVLPHVNKSTLETEFVAANYSFNTLDMSSNTWAPIRSVGLFNVTIFNSDPQFLITRDTRNSPLNVRAIFLAEHRILDGKVVNIYKEIVSNNSGFSWSGPFIVDPYNVTTFTSNYDEVFYVSDMSDGNDYEVYFIREGRLIRVVRNSVSSAFTSEIDFDGVDDFGDLIAEGNYTYRLQLRDDAGNKVITQGWFYADYNAPINTTNLAHNWTFSPTPRLDVNVTVDITDDIGFSAVVYYKRDQGGWVSIPMINVEGDKFSAVIPSDNSTNMIQYYIEAVDLAGNVFNLDRNSTYYTYDMPRYDWVSSGLFNESISYSSSQNYDISITINSDLEYIESIVFRFSLDGGTTWIELELISHSPEFTASLTGIPEDTSILMYEVVLTDIFGEEMMLLETQQISFFPEIPSLSISGPGAIIIVLLTTVGGFVLAYGYINLKSKSHDVIYKQIFLREYTKKSHEIDKDTEVKKKKRLKIGKKREILDEDGVLSGKTAGSSPFTIVYLGMLAATVAMLFIGYIVADINPQAGIFLLADSLVMSIFGYMILISRDISLNIYLEKIFKRNIFLEFFQIGFMLLNIITILFRGYSIPWFRYYLIEQTYELGTLLIPKLYVSVFGVFFTSLILVMITTYIQLRKTVKNVRGQRSQGASDNLLLYIKDQNSSRLITQMGYKTIAFLVTVLLGIVSTTNLLTPETGTTLLVIIIPFVLAGVSALIVHRLLERKSHKEVTEDVELPFIDSKKVCNNCGESIYLSNKYCGSCATQAIFQENIGIYTLKCEVCNNYIHDKAKFCPSCSTEVKQQSKD